MLYSLGVFGLVLGKEGPHCLRENTFARPDELSVIGERRALRGGGLVIFVVHGLVSSQLAGDVVVEFVFGDALVIWDVLHSALV